MKGRRRLSEDDTACVYRPATRLQPIRPVKDPDVIGRTDPAPNYLRQKQNPPLDGFNL